MAALGAGNASAAAPRVVGPRMPLLSVCSSSCSSNRSSSVALASLAFTFPPPPSRFLLHPQRLQEHHHGTTCSSSSGLLPKLPARVQHTSRRSFFVMAPAQSSSGLPSLPKAVLTAKMGLTKPAVNNIAAEGRLTLADARVYACNLKVGKIVHLATLNGARILALRNEIGENVHFAGGIRLGTLSVKATSSSYDGAGNLSGGDDRHTAMSPVGDTEEATEPTPESSKHQGSLKAVGILVAVLGIGCLAALAVTLSSGGPAGLLSTVSKSGFPAAFALIFVSEIGDKTFFIAALLAMRHSKWLVLLGASGALGVMTVISVVIGKLFQRVPAQLQTTLPVGEYAAVALLIWFGLRSIKNAWDIPSAPSGAQSQPAEIGELAEAEEFLKQADKKVTTPLEILVEAFTLIFVAEWGDRSMLATIALGAAQSPWGVASGAIAGHVLATLLAVVGGALLARYLSEKLIGYFGGFLFLGFAGATLAGVF